jgi:hypothetical protein
MPDLYRDVPCIACAKKHNLYDTSAIRHAAGGTYSYTCPATGLEATFQQHSPPEIIDVLPSDAIPTVWVSGWPTSRGS